MNKSKTLNSALKKQKYMEDYPTECSHCGNNSVVFIKNKMRTYHLPNPGKVEITSDVMECQDCGDRYLDEKNAFKVAEKLDAAMGVRKAMRA